jgi:hypothetical protein
MRNNPTCTGCNATMVEGFVIDHGDMQYRMQQLWVSGKPESSFWGGLSTRDRERFYVSAYRCENCGRLEMFANGTA